MITNADYLIQRYAEAREKMNDANTENGRFYWKGAMDTYHAMLNAAFDGWADAGTTGYFVFYHGKTYDEALTELAQMDINQFNAQTEEGELFAI